MKGNEARVIFFIHPVEQLKEGQVVSKVKSSRRSFGVFSILLFGLLIGLCLFIQFGVQTRSLEGIQTSTEPVVTNSTIRAILYGQYYSMVVTNITAEVPSNKTRGNNISTADPVALKETIPQGMVIYLFINPKKPLFHQQYASKY